VENQTDWPAGYLPSIESFLAGESDLPFGLDSYQRCFASPWFFPLQRRRELERMMRIARKIEPRVVMEIGSDKGGGVYHWVKCLPSVRRMIACDIRGCPYWHAMDCAFPEIDFCWVEGPSRAATSIEIVKEFLADDSIDVLFIDGEKSHFREEFLTYAPLVSARGIVFMHDVVEQPMQRQFEECRAGHHWEIVHDISESRELIDPTTPYENWLKHWDGRSCGVGVIYGSVRS